MRENLSPNSRSQADGARKRPVPQDKPAAARPAPPRPRAPPPSLVVRRKVVEPRRRQRPPVRHKRHLLARQALGVLPEHVEPPKGEGPREVEEAAVGQERGVGGGEVALDPVGEDGLGGRAGGRGGGCVEFESVRRGRGGLETRFLPADPKPRAPSARALARALARARALALDSVSRVSGSTRYDARGVSDTASSRGRRPPAPAGPAAWRLTLALSVKLGAPVRRDKMSLAARRAASRGPEVAGGVANSRNTTLPGGGGGLGAGWAAAGVGGGWGGGGLAAAGVGGAWGGVAGWAAAGVGGGGEGWRVGLLLG